MNLSDLRAQWRRNKRYGIPWHEIFSRPLSAAWETFWICRVRGDHLVKMGSHGHCYRCGKAMP